MAIHSGLKLTYPLFLLNYRFWLHLTGWLAFFASPLLLPIPIFKHLPQYYVNYLFITRGTINLILIGIFYLNLLRLTPQLLLTRNSLRFAIYLALLFGLVILLDSLLLQVIKEDLQVYFAKVESADAFSGEITKNPLPGPPQFFGNLILFALIILSSSLWAVLTDRLRQQEFGRQIMYEKTSAELAVLRLQISPHFLFNTLNNIRWLTRIKSDQAETSVMELAEILRYMLYQVSHDKVDLNDEVNYLNRYVNLQKMRTPPDTEVNFTCDGYYHDVRIEPLLFMPFVENAFKFGIHSEEPSKISIYLMVKSYELLFVCENQCFDLAGDDLPGTGLGLLNVKRRLELHYPKTHTLVIDNEKGIFSVELKLNLRNA